MPAKGAGLLIVFFFQERGACDAGGESVATGTSLQGFFFFSGPVGSPAFAGLRWYLQLRGRLCGTAGMRKAQVQLCRPSSKQSARSPLSSAADSWQR